MSLFMALGWFVAGAAVAWLWGAWTQWDHYKEQVTAQRKEIETVYFKMLEDFMATETARIDGFILGCKQSNQAWQKRLTDAYAKERGVNVKN